MTGCGPMPAVPTWVPSAVGASALVPMTNTLDSVVVNHSPLGTAGAGNNAFAQYSGGVYNPHYGTWGAHVIHGGGHSATHDNSVFIADYNDLAFKRLSTPPLLPNQSDYDDLIRTGGFPDSTTANPREIATGVPGSSHTYDTLLIVPPSVCGDSKGGLLRPVASAIGYSASRETGWSHLFTFTNGAWSRWSTNSASSAVPGGSCVFDSTRNKVWPLFSENTSFTPSLNLATRTWANTGGGPLGVSGYPDMCYSAYAAHRDIVVFATHAASASSTNFYWFSASGDGKQRNVVSFSSGSLPTAIWGRGALLYIPEMQKLIWFSNNGTDLYYEIDVPANPASQWSWVSRPITGAARPSQLSPVPYNSTYRRFDYSPQLKSLMWVTAQSPNLLSFGGRVVCIRVVP